MEKPLRHFSFLRQSAALHLLALVVVFVSGTNAAMAALPSQSVSGLSTVGGESRSSIQAQYSLSQGDLMKTLDKPALQPANLPVSGGIVGNFQQGGKEASNESATVNGGQSQAQQPTPGKEKQASNKVQKYFTYNGQTYWAPGPGTYPWYTDQAATVGEKGPKTETTAVYTSKAAGFANVPGLQERQHYLPLLVRHSLL